MNTCVCRVPGYVGDCNRPECVIAELRAELAAMCRMVEAAHLACEPGRCDACDALREAART